jgi:Cu2+-exporting ATPase
MKDSKESNHEKMEDMGKRTQSSHEDKTSDDTSQKSMMSHPMKDHEHMGERDGSSDVHHEMDMQRGEHSMELSAQTDHLMEGYDHGPHNHQGHHMSMIKDFKNRFLICIFLTIPVFILTPAVQGLFGIGPLLNSTNDNYLLFIISSIVYFYGGYPFFKGLINEIKSLNPGMMTLVSVAITTAYIYSSAVVFGLMGSVFFLELVTLVDIMLLGHWIEMRSIMGASNALEELATLMPSKAHKIMPDQSIMDVVIEELIKGDHILVKPGEKIASDGIVFDGESWVDESLLTGESIPVHKRMGDELVGGSLNGEGSIVLEVKNIGSESFISQVIELVKQAQESKSRTQDIANRAALLLTLVALTGGTLTFLAWFYFLNQTTAFALERTVTVMVTTCPHALGLAVPLVVAVSTSLSAKKGLLIKNRSAFENARKIDSVIFDKTGTLTMGEFGITDVVLMKKDGEKNFLTEDELINYAASLESNSEHPIARSIAEKGIKKLPIKDFKSIPGKGVQGKVSGYYVKVVGPAYLKEQGIIYDEEKVKNLKGQAKTLTFIIVDGELEGCIALADIIRPESKDAIEQLKNNGIKCIMLTGDNREVAAWVSDELGLDEYFAEVLPSQKAEKVRDVQSRGMTVAMTGDGVNDAPALAQADLGIAVGAGTDIAIETADIILVKSNPKDIVELLKLSKATYGKMVQNLMWATGYNIFAIPLAAGVLYAYGLLLTPAMGAILMSMSTVIVAVNARFLRIK